MIIVHDRLVCDAIYITFIDYDCLQGATFRADIGGSSREGSPWICPPSADAAEPRCVHAPRMAFSMDDNVPSQYIFSIAEY